MYFIQGRENTMQGNQSEVAHLLQQITQEYEAATSGLKGIAAVARHKVITTRMENMYKLQEELTTLVGKQQAVVLVAETLENA